MPVVQSLPTAGNDLVSTTPIQSTSEATSQVGAIYSQPTVLADLMEGSKETEPAKVTQPEPGQTISNVDPLVTTSPQFGPLKVPTTPAITSSAGKLSSAPTPQVPNDNSTAITNTPTTQNKTSTTVPSPVPTREQPANSKAPGTTNTPVIQPQTPIVLTTALPSKTAPVPTVEVVPTYIPAAPVVVPSNTPVSPVVVVPTDTPVLTAVPTVSTTNTPEATKRPKPTRK